MYDDDDEVLSGRQARSGFLKVGPAVSVQRMRCSPRAHIRTLQERRPYTTTLDALRPKMNYGGAFEAAMTYESIIHY